MRAPDFATILGAADRHPAVAALRRLDEGVDRPALFLVGGAVRDLVLGREPTDLDILVEGPLHPILAVADTVVRTHARFGTATVRIAGEEVDLAAARTETYRRPGALPTVEPATAADDLRRRDFTVNAVALRLTGESAGTVLTPPHALQDLAAGRLRILHRESFTDDPTRVLRLARYSARLGFTVEPGTAELARAAVSAGAFDTVSGARLGHELRLLADEPDPVAGLIVLGELRAGEGLAPGFGVADPSLARAALTLVPADGRPGRLALALALRGVDEGEATRLLERLRLPGRERSRILETVRASVPISALLASARQPSELLDGLRGAPVEAVALAGALGPSDAARRWLSDLRHRRLAISGADLLAVGIPESPAVLRGLRAAEAAMLDGEAPGRAEQLAVALRASEPDGATG